LLEFDDRALGGLRFRSRLLKATPTIAPHLIDQDVDGLQNGVGKLNT